jgi:hypothetical protein
VSVPSGGFGPPHPSYQVPAPAPQAAAPAATAGPAPRRNRVGLLLQFVLQFVYIPLWVLLLVALIVFYIWSDANGDLPGGDGLLSVGSTAISWRRFLAEWTGDPRRWEQLAGPLLEKAFAQAEKNGGWEAAKLPPTGIRRVTAQLPVRHYRGLAPARLEGLVRQRGWSVDWERSRKPERELHFFRLMPPPAPPTALTGPGWDPMPARLLVPLLTLPLLPRVRTLELRRDAAAYRGHLAARLDARCRAELARPAKRRSYCPDEHGTILRRVQITVPHYRLLGAREALRLAEERGWQLDTTYPARPENSLRVCRPDTLAD